VAPDGAACEGEAVTAANSEAVVVSGAAACSIEIVTESEGGSAAVAGTSEAVAEPVIYE
jgi:hypothetical protein